jgi:hypothetical protein
VLWGEPLRRDEEQAYWPALRAVTAFPHAVFEPPGLSEVGCCQGQHCRDSSIQQQEPVAVPVVRGQVQLGCLQREVYSLNLVSAFRRPPRLVPWPGSAGRSGSRLEAPAVSPGARRLLGSAPPPATLATPGEHYESRPPGFLPGRAPLPVVQAAGEAGAVFPCHSSHVRRGFAPTQVASGSWRVPRASQTRCVSQGGLPLPEQVWRQMQHSVPPRAAANAWRRRAGGVDHRKDVHPACDSEPSWPPSAEWGRRYGVVVEPGHPPGAPGLRLSAPSRSARGSPPPPRSPRWYSCTR